MKTSQIEHTSVGAALSNVILDLFRVSNSLLTQGDRLVAPLGLTSARWQVLGTIIKAERPQPVAWLARDMGANRQNVQRIVNDLAKEEWVEFAENPHHRRAALVMLTVKGRAVFDAAMALESPWMNALAEGLELEDIAKVQHVLKLLSMRLESSET
jgi:DNA-binding MarR family transcriptional regulator